MEWAVCCLHMLTYIHTLQKALLLQLASVQPKNLAIIIIIIIIIIICCM